MVVPSAAWTSRRYRKAPTTTGGDLDTHSGGAIRGTAASEMIWNRKYGGRKPFVAGFAQLRTGML
jgi:hypothetical protein